MNLLDVLIVACMGFLIVRGIFRGFVREVGSLAGIILGIWAACVYPEQVTGLLKGFLPNWTYLPLLSVALIILVVLVACNVVAWLLQLFLKKVFLGWVDRSLGVGLALIKGVVIVYFAIVLMTFFVPDKSSFIAESALVPIIVQSYQSMTGVLSPEAYENLKKKLVGQKERAFSSLAVPKKGPSGNDGR